MKNFTLLFFLCLSSLLSAQVDLPITFEDTANIDYKLVDFGGNASSIVTDPTDPNNFVGQAIKTDMSELWAGTTMGGDGLENAIAFSTTDTKMSVRVWSPDAGIPVRLKVEDAADAAISVETEAMTTVAMAWETLEFNFSNQADGTAALNLANTYDKVSIFFNFGTTGMEAGEKTYYWDDVTFLGGGGSNKDQVDLPITFEDTATVDYAMVDFGGNASAIIADPTDPNNLVGRAIKTDMAELWAGTTVGGAGLASRIAFSTTDTKMSVRIWSPDAGIPIRLKVENALDAAISVETETMTTTAMAWETLEFNFSNQVDGTAALNLANTYDKVSIFFNFGTTGAEAGEKTYYWDDITFLGGGGSGKDQVDLPITFEDTATVDYALVDFGGNASAIIADPTDPNNLVGRAIKTDMAELWAGTTIGGAGLVTAIPFSNSDTKMSVRVWSPDAGISVRLKVEDALNAAISVETEAMTTTAMAWETLEFDFINQVDGTAAIDFGNTYNKVSIFFNFGTTGAEAGEKTYYWDDIEFIGGGGSGKDQVDLPITFEDTATVDYALVDFGGNASSIIADPTDPNNLVGQAIKTDMAELWAGTTIGGNGLASVIPFAAGETKMSVRVWSPDAGIPVRIKVEDATNAAISVETETATTTAMAWETIELDFANQADGTAAINFANTYDKISIFFNFGTTGAEAGEKTYYWDDIQFVGAGGGGGGKDQIDLPVTFEDTASIDYALEDFGGNASTIIVDPTDPNNLVGQAVKTDMAELWAGTTMGRDGLASAIPFAAGATKMTVRVWSPDAGIPVRIKVEDATNAAISVETETATTTAMAWETIELDFANQADGTAAIDFANTYDKISIFFNFGTTGMEAGEKTYYWDDVEFIGSGKDQIDLPITFEDTATIDYALVDFGGNASTIIVDPTDPNNLVGQAVKTDMAELWAGTTMGANGLASAIPFAAGATKMTVRVWSPDAGIPVRIKVEDATNAAISVETETATTTAMAWETIELDFANQADGTAAIDFANTYDKISIFFNFGTTGTEAGEKTYFWDDVEFIGSGKEQVDLPITFEDTTNVDYALADFGGNVSSIVVDPTDPDNVVGQAIKTTMAETWAGTTIGGSGLANPIPFAMNNTKMNVRVWSPDAGIPIRLKVEDASNAAISVETEAMTTTAMAWETLEFDFANQADGTSAIDFANTYNKISIFFNFGTAGTDAGEITYFWDDVFFGGVTGIKVLDAAENGIKVFPNPASDFFQIEFEESLDQTVQLTLFDVHGKLLRAARTTDQISRINVNDMNPGMYFLRIEKDNIHYFQKLMIAK